MRLKSLRTAAKGCGLALAAAGVAALCATPLVAAPPARNASARPAAKRKPPQVSFMPPGNLEQFVVSQFDIRTINSSVNIGRETYQARLLELGYRPLLRDR